MMGGHMSGSTCVWIPFKVSDEWLNARRRGWGRRAKTCIACKLHKTSRAREGATGRVSLLGLGLGEGLIDPLEAPVLSMAISSTIGVLVLLPTRPKTLGLSGRRRRRGEKCMRWHRRIGAACTVVLDVKVKVSDSSTSPTLC